MVRAWKPTHIGDTNNTARGEGGLTYRVAVNLGRVLLVVFQSKAAAYLANKLKSLGWRVNIQVQYRDKNSLLHCLVRHILQSVEEALVEGGLQGISG